MALVALDNSLEANQRSRVIIDIDGRNTVLYVKLRWHVKTEKWMLSLFDEEGNPIIRNIPLVTSRSFPSADLLNQFAYMFVGHASVLPTVNKPTTMIPDRTNLGVNREWMLVWGLPDE